MTINMNTGENRHLVPVEKVLLDGEDVSSLCRIASEEEGYVVLMVRKPDAKNRYDMEFDPIAKKFITERREGKVEIILR